MKSRDFLLLLFLSIFTTAMAQEKKSFTLEDLMPGGSNYYNLQPKNEWYEWWGDKACMKLGIDDIQGIWTGIDGNKAGGRFTVITLEEVNNLLEKNGLSKISHFYNASFPFDKKRPDDKMLLVNTKSDRVLIDWAKKAIVWSQKRDEKGANEDWNTLSRNLAFTIDNNLYLKTADGKQYQVTDEPDGIVCGQSVHRNEFGITKGTFWSPNGNQLAFYSMDQSMVTDYPQVDISKRVAELVPDKYPMAGMTSHKVKVGIFNLSTQKSVYLDTGDNTDKYYTCISWSPDEKNIYLVELNRDQNCAELIKFDASTGEKLKTFFREEHPKYVEPSHPLTFLPWDDSKFIYQNQRDGFNHLYLYNTNGKEIKQLTSGKWLVLDLLGFNIKDKEVIISSTEISPLQSNIFGVNIANGKRHLIGEKDAYNSPMLSHGGGFALNKFTSHNVPRTIELISTSAKGRKFNLTLLSQENPMKDYKMPEITVGTIKAADGITDLYYRMVKPIDFDAKKKYPAVIYVYGGPHAQLIHNTLNYDTRGWDIYMAQKGYIVFTVDNRGSENRGLEFENVTFRNLGTEEMKDQIKGVEFLKSLPYVDADKLGVHGWSFGGFMTTNLMLTYPEIFKVGVAGGPVINWEYYEIMYGERYMDKPQDNPEGYKKANLTLRAGNLKGRLEIIIGGNDPVCVPQHSYSFLRAAIDAGAQPDFFVYPGSEHNMVGKDRVHLYEHITRYFEDHLK